MKLKEMLKENYIIFDGAFGTYYLDITSDTEAPEHANVSNPEVVSRIHSDYIKAGANIIRTNTFASNSNTLGTIENVKENIKLAVANAKRAVDENKDDTAGVIVAGDIGPIEKDINYAYGDTTKYDDEYKIICDEFIKNGIQVIVFETFPNLDEILPAIDYIKRKYTDIFIIVQFCINQFGYTNDGLRGESLLNEAIKNPYIDATGFNCGVGPGHLFTLYENMSIAGDKFLTALPNASYPRIIKDRMVFMKNENYFIDKMKDIAQLGIDFLGGCCGTKPEYIKMLSQELHNKEKCEKNVVSTCCDGHSVKVTDTSFYKDRTGKKLIAVELAPPMDADYKKIMDASNSLRKLDVDVITFPDSPSGRTRADSILMAAKVAMQTGMCVMPHICCRDKNAIAIRAQLLGAHINDITNFLVVTGDPVSTSMRQDVKSVFNFDSCGMMKIIKDMNESQFYEKPLTYGGAINYARTNIEVEIRRIKKKMDLGASFFFTQPLFCKEDVEKVRYIKEQTGARILCGIMPLVSHRNALFIKNEMVGIHVPQEVVDMYENVTDKETAQNIGVKIAREMMELSKKFADGFYFSIPFNRVQLMERILDK